ncbi:MAG: hypothetical protein IIB43_08900 [Candidatus Marinimicrobia bacterium]|nr:hypothetical protein [Candidatus Neomarinimicrobiota bacterium]
MIRIGARPTSKAFTGILSRHPGKLYVISASGLWDDPDQQASAVYAADPTGFCRALASEVGSQAPDENWLASLRKFDRQAHEVIRESIAPEAPFFEGQVANLCVQLLPAILLVWRVPAAPWAWPAFAPTAAIVVLLVLFATDNLLNAMPNPVFVTCAGGIGGLACRLRRKRSMFLPADQATPAIHRIVEVPGVRH